MNTNTNHRLLYFRAALGLCLILAHPATSAPMQFRNVTAEAGISHVFSHDAQDSFLDELLMSGGAAAEDFDGDGFLDLYVLQGGVSGNLLYMNNGDGTFSDEAGLRGVDVTVPGMGASAADYDNDGDVDIFITTLPGPTYLFINDGAGHFTTDQSAVTGLRLNVTSPSWGDVDNDGLLDLSVGLWQRGIWGNFFIFHNRGTEGLVSYGFRETPYLDKYAFTGRFADLNNDRRVDIPATCDFGNSQLYLNVGEGIFRRMTGTNGTGSDENGMGSAIGDYDNDGDLDWFVASIFDDSGDDGRGVYEWGNTGNRLYRNNGDASFTDVTDAAGVRHGFWGWGSSFGDLDNDGDLDLYHVNGWIFDTKFNNDPQDAYRFHDKPSRLFENQGDGTFVETAAEAGADESSSGRGLILFDYDNDGDLDIFTVSNFEAEPGLEVVDKQPGIPVLLRNDSQTSNHWLKVTLEGEPPLHRQGIGSRVYVTAGGQTQMRELHASTNYLAQEPGRIAHFGLGAVQTAREVRAEWVNGDACVCENVRADQSLVLPSPIGRVSKRLAAVGEEITASAESASAKGLRAEWIVTGRALPDPATAVFRRPGKTELRLNLYSIEGGDLVCSELIRLEIYGEASKVPAFSHYE